MAESPVPTQRMEMQREQLPRETHRALLTGTAQNGILSERKDVKTAVICKASNRIPFRQVCRFPRLICRLFAAWVLSAAVQYLLLPQSLRELSDTAGLSHMSFGLTLALWAGIAAAGCLLASFVPTERIERGSILLGTFVLAALALAANLSWTMQGACILLVVIASACYVRGWDGSPEPCADVRGGHWGYPLLTTGLTLAFFLFVSVWTVGRVVSYCAPSYDFGIFSQMFYYMKETGAPMTTLERDGLLSHFAVHVSPVYYLMLPFFALVPRPATLQVLQAAVLASAVIPAWKIAGRHGLSHPAKMLVCALLLLFPAYSGGTSYDLHENCFLTPLLLWLLYGLDTGSIPISAIFAALTLSVKEDAAMYAAVIGLWAMVRALLRREKRQLLLGTGILLGSVLWFLAVTAYLSSDGQGVMTYRYKNFYFGDSASLLTLVQAVIMNPMKAVYECMEPEKLGMLGLTMGALVGLPLLTRRYERYLLLIPYLLMNLMSDYQYQYNIFYQYTFGSTALLIYLTIVNLADIRIPRRRMAALICSVAVSAGCFAHTVLPTALHYPAQCAQYRSYYRSVRESLEQVPEDASVCATTFYTVSLSQRKILYDLRYCSQEHVMESEYIVLNARSTGDYKKYDTDGEHNGFVNLTALLEESGYVRCPTANQDVVIYHRETP